MNGYEYENKCAKLLDFKGFSNINVTKGSGDQGIDIIAYKFKTKYGIQCKYYTGTVGNKAIQEAYAGAAYYGCTKSIVITNSTFSKQAIELANELGVEIWEHIDAIYLQKNSKNNEVIYQNLTQEEIENIQIQQIEEYLQEKYKSFQAKYPENIKKYQEITSYAYKIKNELRQCSSSYRNDLRIIKTTEIDYHTFKNKRDPKIKSIIDQTRKRTKRYEIQLKTIMDEVNTKATSYMQEGISIQSINVLADLIISIFDCGENECEIYIHFRGYDDEKKIATFTWSEKYIRMTYKWKRIKDELPADPQEENLNNEKNEKINCQHKLDTIRKNLTTKKSELQMKQDNLETLENQLKDQESKLQDMENNYPIMYKELQANFNDTEIILQEKLNNDKETLEKLNKDKIEKIEKLNTLSAFSFKQKHILKNSINELEEKINDVEHSFNDIEAELKHAKIFYETRTQAPKDRIDDLKQQINQTKKTIFNQQLTIKNQKRKIAKLDKEIIDIEERLKNFHRIYLLENYKHVINAK